MAVMIEQSPKTLILKGPGINCDNETQYAFNLAGATAEIKHINQLKNGEVRLGDYQILAIPGGFSWGDHLGSGEVFAANLVLPKQIADQVLEHAVHQRRAVIGICNGFQVLTRSGLLPWTDLTTLDHVKTSLTSNQSGHFDYDWIRLRPETNSASLFQLPREILTLPVAHGEGRLYAREETIKEIENQGLVVFRYCDAIGVPTQHYPENPNGSLHAIAGICNKEGNIIGLMPHPERFVDQLQHPNKRRLPSDYQPDGLKIIKSIVDYAKQL